MQLVRLVSARFQLRDHVLHFLQPVAIGDQDRVGGIDDDQPVYPDRRDQAILRVDVGIVAVHHDRLTEGAIALRVRRGQLRHRAPGSPRDAP